jgi:hypothetical protein
MANNGTKRLQVARAFILENWIGMSDRQMADELETTKDNVAHRRKRLGLVRSDENRRELFDRSPARSGWKRKAPYL